ncbi:hypothetical protein NP511_02295 [Natrinema thermotolerans]|uniref:Uncharacterized protein n=1 Tax=Natrinema thermotolerans TaxID=121872 RepID=A0AAF0PD94_9EURY|nr:hypothetical protein [Natrinema thermotolerans]ELZ15635.1 hypothetical protein C478_05299 [Natrinema thermotolerans DSM 11552]QCC60791.1 hypothetical protein DVR14_19975 [Natrinema thermotolerans]QCC61670.1 hypothetical protein DVR14_24115 [Natrinema thermotolerans]WMT07839.1 hypothetical protein NP511_21010 [Natrinema thermotolerans]WMT08471.1 hypothetical protein NP511_02295 [Natrinema thermotolerans]
MGETIPIAVPRKGRPLESVLDRLADRLDVPDLADDITSTLRHEKALTKGTIDPDEEDVYHRLAAYSTVDDPTAPEYTLLRDDRAGKPRRIVFDSVTIPLSHVESAPDGAAIQLVGREEPFRSLRTHEFALGFDSADLVLEEVVELRAEPLNRIADINARINPSDTDVQVVTGMGDTVYHTLLATPEVAPSEGSLDRDFLEAYQGPLCIEPRYERLVQAVLGTRALEGIEFRYPEEGREEEAAIAETGLGVYLTVTGSTARDHGLLLGEQLFPSETVLLENTAETTETVAFVRSLLNGGDLETELAVGH